jgi:hypothetical protein
VRSQLHDIVNLAFSCKIFDGNAQISVVMNGEKVIFARYTVQFHNENYLNYHVLKNNCETLMAIICLHLSNKK